MPNSNSPDVRLGGDLTGGRVYSGDSNNVGATSVCSAELLIVGTTTTLTTQHHLHTGTITAGSSDFDTANLSSAFVEGGTGGTVIYTRLQRQQLHQRGPVIGTI